MDAMERLVKTCQCPLVSAQYLMLVNRLRASAPCLEALEMVLTERVFTDEKEDSGKRTVVVVDVWQPLFLKVGTGYRTEQCCLSGVLIPGCGFFHPGSRNWIFPSRIRIRKAELTKNWGFCIVAISCRCSGYGIKLLTSCSNSSLLECSPPTAEVRVRCQSRVL